VRKEGIRILLLATAIAAVPILGTIFVATTTSEPDLSELVPIYSRIANRVILSWSALLRDHQFDIQKATLRISGSEIQAIGYMFDADQPVSKGEWVKEFVLLPEAGSFVHPAHRIRDQMITVHLEDGGRIQFAPRTLIWVWGNFLVSSAPAVRSQPLYTLEGARAQPADKADIRKYFR
jgi:hypothetical protein